MNDKEIHIDNLTIYQQHLLDKIWSCKTENALRSWLVTLPSNVLREAMALILVLQLENLDQELDSQEENLSSTKKYLKKFML